MATLLRGIFFSIFLPLLLLCYDLTSIFDCLCMLLPALSNFDDLLLCSGAIEILMVAKRSVRRVMIMLFWLAELIALFFNQVSQNLILTDWDKFTKTNT